MWKPTDKGRFDSTMRAFISDPFQVLVVLFGIVFLATWLDKKYKWARNLSPVILILAISAIASNLEFIPTEISADFSLYGDIMGFTIPFAVCLVLFQVQFVDLKKAGLQMLCAFGIACVGVFIGAVGGAVLLSEQLGPDAWKLAAPYTGTYIGGSLNFNALWHEFEVGDGALFGAANAVDNLTLIPIFFFLLIVPERLVRFFPVAKRWHTFRDDIHDADEKHKDPSLNVYSLAALTFCALSVMLLSDLTVLGLEKLASKFAEESFLQNFLSNVPSILILTSYALILAQFPRVAAMDGSHEIGNYAFYLFFAAIGATCNIASAIASGPVLFLYVSIIIGFGMVFLFVIGRLCKMDPRVLACASMAAKAGPPAVLALAEAKEWKEFALPGVAVGLLGYALGNYVGTFAGYLVKFILGA
jgi:uncharacterized membrane protein